MTYRRFFKLGLVCDSADRLDLERVPPYAPMLDQIEQLWGRLNWERRSNFLLGDAAEIETRVVTLSDCITFITLDGLRARKRESGKKIAKEAARENSVGELIYDHLAQFL